MEGETGMNRQRRGALGASLLVLLVIEISACRLQPPYPSQPVEVMGASDRARLAPQVLPPAEPDFTTRSPLFTSGTISAVTTAEDAGAALDPLPARLAAKEKARQEARRSLARQIEAIELEPGQTVAGVLLRDQAKRRALEQLLRDAREATVRDTAGRHTVTLSVETSAVRHVLDVKPPPSRPPMPQPAVLQPLADPLAPVINGLDAEVRRRAEAEAIVRARARALDFVRSVRTAQGALLGDLMLGNPAFSQAVRDRIDAAPPRIRYTEDGVCQATITIDLADIRQSLSETLYQPRGRLTPAPRPIVR
jgi:hypothetical protein